MSCKIINLSGYKFVELDALNELQGNMLQALQNTGVLGTILLAREGINVALAGDAESIAAAEQWFRDQSAFNDLWFKKSESTFTPFSKLKVRIRPEIITFDGGKTKPAENPAPEISPRELKRWLDEKKDFILLDTRNNYETESGTFSQAHKLDLENFRDFPDALNQLTPAARSKPIVTFCTGGVRCEKAAPWMLAHGFQEVYQVKGGILNYLDQCGGSHWEGECFVFDDRVEINASLAETTQQRCSRCHRAATKAAQNGEVFKPKEQCQDCLSIQRKTGLDTADVSVAS